MKMKTVRGQLVPVPVPGNEQEYDAEVQRWPAGEDEMRQLLQPVRRVVQLQEQQVQRVAPLQAETVPHRIALSV